MKKRDCSGRASLLSREFQRKQDDLNEEVTAAQGDIVDTIGRKMLDVLDRYSRENGYVVVLDSSAQGSPVVYGATQVDVTQEIVRLYDQAYPVKAGARAGNPASPQASRLPEGCAGARCSGVCQPADDTGDYRAQPREETQAMNCRKGFVRQR